MDELVFLVEAGEDLFNVFVGESDTSVLYIHLNFVAALQVLPSEGDLAFFCEFACVGDEVGENLDDAVEVDVDGDVVFGFLVDKLQMFGYELGFLLVDFLEYVTYGMLLDVELHLARLYRREVENVVDQCEK